EALDHDALAGGRTLGDHLQRIPDRPGADGADLDPVVGTHERELREALEILHRALWHHERPLQNVQLDANPRVLTRAQQEVGIGKDALYQDRARVRVHLAARRIACAAIRIDGAVGEDQLLRAGREAPGANRFADARRVLQILLLAHREGHADRIDLRDGGERPGVVGTDQV